MVPENEKFPTFIINEIGRKFLCFTLYVTVIIMNTMELPAYRLCSLTRRRRRLYGAQDATTGARSSSAASEFIIHNKKLLSPTQAQAQDTTRGRRRRQK